MLDDDGQPVALLAGRAFEVLAGEAYEVAKPDREPVVVLTNRQGRFAAQGLRPGRWRIEMPTTPKSVFYIDVPATAEGLVRLGDLKPGSEP
jgi:outer membrane usher protein